MHQLESRSWLTERAGVRLPVGRMDPSSKMHAGRMDGGAERCDDPAFGSGDDVRSVGLSRNLPPRAKQPSTYCGATQKHVVSAILVPDPRSSCTPYRCRVTPRKGVTFRVMYRKDVTAGSKAAIVTAGLETDPHMAKLPSASSSASGATAIPTRGHSNSSNRRTRCRANPPGRRHTAWQPRLDHPRHAAAASRRPAGSSKSCKASILDILSNPSIS